MVFPYNMLLQHVFKSKDGFGVAPQYSPDESLEAIDFTTIYIMERNRHPVLVLDIKPHPILSISPDTSAQMCRSTKVSTSSEIILSFLDCMQFWPLG